MYKRLPKDWTEEQRIAYKRELSRIRNRRYREKHGPSVNVRWAKNNPEKAKARSRDYYLKNRDRLLERQKSYYLKNKDSLLAYQKHYYQKNLPRIIAREKAYHAAKPHIARAAKLKWIKNKVKTDPLFRLVANLRRRLRFLVTKKSNNHSKLLGCTPNELRDHLEFQFEDWMNWENYGFGKGKWVVDHIRPCSSFDLSKASEQAACFHYTNLQPLCWRKNMLKSDS